MQQDGIPLSLAIIIASCILGVMFVAGMVLLAVLFA
jgi:hypothetical protein